MKTFLHIGCGTKHKEQTTQGFNTPDWNELRLDIDDSCNPDYSCSITDMSVIKDASIDAIFSSHNIEHLYPHEVSLALREFKRVLKPEGFAVITCPDLQSVAALIADNKLTEPAYNSPAGAIAPLDIFYGHRPSMANGKVYMAHHCGFTQKVLTSTMLAAGFATVASIRRTHPFYDLWIIASISSRDKSDMRLISAEHFPA